jgi:transcription termination/antitermination protein NusG
MRLHAESEDEMLDDKDRQDRQEEQEGRDEPGQENLDAEDLDLDSLFIDLPDEADAEADAETAVEPGAEAADADAGTGTAADPAAAAAESDLDAPGELTEQDLLAAIELPISADDQAEIERRSRLEWYTLHANTGHENKVKRNIEMAIKSNHMEEYFGDVLVPIQEVTEMKNGKRVTTKRKYLPGYLLIEMQMNKETHHFINSIPGVTGFIGGTPLKPQPVAKDEVDHLLGRMKEPADGKETLEIPYKVGDSVQVMDGPFTDWVGVINEINHEKGKLKVMISIFGKDTPVELDFLQVKQN